MTDRPTPDASGAAMSQAPDPPMEDRLGAESPKEGAPEIQEEVANLLALYQTHHRGESLPSEIDTIVKAYTLARHLHEPQLRRSGDPYITHPLAVAEILAEYGMDRDTIVAAVLHDTVEDTEMELDEIEATFGSQVAYLIDGVTKLDRIKFASREEAQAATIRKMVVAMAEDVRVLLIKLADRLHNIRTIKHVPPEKQERVARETLEVYAPLAHRLGVQEIKHEMENTCFEVLFPGRFSELIDKIEQRSPERQALVDKAITELRSMLSDGGIDAEVSGRPKQVYSIYKKMVDSGQDFENIHDLIGVRIITASLRDCYAALGLVHSIWAPVQGRFKDYVAMPKFNFYQSLHTTVIGPDGKPLEVQIRSWDMHQRAEFGVAAHWRYKERMATHDELPWLADLRVLQDEHADPQDFLASLKLDLYQDEVFVVTPAGDVFDLPKGSTAVDFAYHVHTDVGHRCTGAKVNGRLVSLDTQLVSGDIVEIITSKGDGGPSQDWLQFVRTSRAKAKIRQWFSKERREEALEEGREGVLALLRKEGLGLGAAERDRLLTGIATDFGFGSLDALFASVGENATSAPSVIGKLVRIVRPESDDEIDLLSPPPSRPSRLSGPGVIVEGLDDVWVRIAQCCAPVPGDDVVGFVTVGRGVSVHRSDCTNMDTLTEQRDRMIDVSWSPDRVGRFTVWIQVECLDRSGLLRDVSACVTDVGGNIVASSSATSRDRVAVLRYEVELSDAGQVDKLVGQLRAVDGVYEAFRIMPQGGS